MGRDARAESVSQPPFPRPRSVSTGVQRSKCFLGHLSSDVCKVNHTDECWWLLMCSYSIQKTCV